GPAWRCSPTRRGWAWPARWRRGTWRIERPAASSRRRSSRCTLHGGSASGKASSAWRRMRSGGGGADSLARANSAAPGGLGMTAPTPAEDVQGEATPAEIRLSHAAMGGVAWQGFSYLLGKVLVLASTVVLARLLTPSDF